MSQSTFKQIRVWKVVLLTVVTLGVYSLVWLLKRRSELPQELKNKAPHWGWLIGIVGCMVIGTALFNFGTIAIADSQVAAEISTYGSYVVMVLVVVALTWWTVGIARAINAAIKLSLPTPLLIAVCLLFAEAMVVYQQYAINGSKSTAALKKLFRPFAVMSIVIGMIILVATYAMYPIDAQIKNAKTEHEKAQQELDSLDTTINEASKEVNEVKKLAADYKACTDKLDTDYPEPEVSQEAYAAYKVAYDKCDAMYKQLQQKAE